MSLHHQALILLAFFSCLYACAGGCWDTTVVEDSKFFRVDGENLNFTAKWNPCPHPNASHNFNISRVEFVGKDCEYVPLCEASGNATSCYIGSKLLEGKIAPFDHYFLRLVMTTPPTCRNGSTTLNIGVSQKEIKVGPPEVLNLQVSARTVSFVVRGAKTPYFLNGRRFKSSPGNGTNTNKVVYMGLDAAMDTVRCYVTLLDSTGYKIEQVHGSLGEKDASYMAEFAKLTPFTTYAIKKKCKLRGDPGREDGFEFTTFEDVPGSGPTISKPGSVGLGCDKPDHRNVTITIEPPPAEQRFGILKFYEIRYRVAGASSDDTRGWKTMIHSPLPHPTPPLTEVTLPALSRWKAYEIVVYANNSAGGAPSSTHQVDILKPNDAESRVKNLTKVELEPKVWSFHWLPPWSSHTGDCVVNYTISAAGFVEVVSNTSYILDTRLIPESVSSVKVAALIHNGTGPPAKGIQSETTVNSDSSSTLSKSLIIVVVVALAMFLIVAAATVYMCIEHGPRWTDSLDIRNNSILKAALAMGELRPRAPAETEKFDTLVSDPPPPPPNDDANDAETSALLETETANAASEHAESHTPTSQQTPPLSEARGPARIGFDVQGAIIAMEIDADDSSSMTQSSDEEVETSGGSLPSSTKKDSITPRMSCSEESLTHSSPPQSPMDSGYVTSSSLFTQPLIPKSPAPSDYSSNGYVPCSINFKSEVLQRRDCNANQTSNYYSHQFIADQSKLSYQPTTDANEKISSHGKLAFCPPDKHPHPHPLLKMAGRQLSLDSEGVSSGSLSPCDSDMGEYTKLSCPNTPISPRSNGDLQSKLELESSLKTIPARLAHMSDLHQVKLSNVG